VTARDATARGGVAGVEVDVIGSGNPAFLGGRTDLRGVFVAEGVRGQVTALARREPNGYAFYRGPASLGPAAEAPARPAVVAGERGRPSALDAGLRGLNDAGQGRQIDEFERRYRGRGGAGGGLGGMGGGGFR
jgi:hypothetical protein